MLLAGTLLGAAWLGVFVAGHLTALLVWPRPRRASVALWLLLLAVAGALISTATLPLESGPWASPGSHRVVAAVGATVTLACGFVLWMPAYYVVVSSISAQMLVRLEAHPSGGMPLEALAGADTSREIVSPRLASMVASGLLVQQGGRYRVSTKGRRTVRAFRTLRRIWRLDLER